jgi:hypothetical protein
VGNLELKKHENELKLLKQKWETIVSQDLDSPARPSIDRRDSSEPSSPLEHRRHSKTRQLSMDSNPSPTAPKAMELPTDIGLGAVPMSAAHGNAGYDVSAAAKRWMGGLVKTGFNGVSGLLDGLHQEQKEEAERQVAAAVAASLAPVREEESDEEENRRTGTMAVAAGGATTDGVRSPTKSDRRTSGSSVASTEASSSSHLDSARSSVTSFGSHEAARKARDDGERTPTMLSEADNDETHGKEVKATKHARRRSTMDMVGSWGNGLGKRWQEVRESETCVCVPWRPCRFLADGGDACSFRQSRRATASLLDSFEKTLADAITLDPRPGKPDTLSMDDDDADDTMTVAKTNGAIPSALPSGVGAFGWGANFHHKPRVSPQRSMEPGTEWDWNALGDGPHSDSRKAAAIENLLDANDTPAAEHPSLVPSPPSRSHPLAGSATTPTAPTRSAKARAAAVRARHSKRMSLPVAAKVEEETEEWAAW